MTTAAEWFSAALLLLSIWWWHSTGWRAVAAPALGMFGCAGFFVVALLGDVYGIATLNFVLCFVNGRNFAIALARWLP